jgi:integrase
MPKIKLTDRYVQSATAPDAGRSEIGDLLCPGLYLRTTATGAKSWAIVARLGGRVQRVTLGRYPVITLAQARQETLRIMREWAERGSSSLHANDSGPAVPPGAPCPTFSELIDAYVAHISRSARSWKLIASNLRRAELQPLHASLATMVGKRELMVVVDEIAAAGTPHAAASVLRHLKMALNFAVQRDLISANPLAGVKPPVRGNERDRVLSDDEIRAVWAATFKLPDPYGQMYRLFFLTGCRRSEVATMQHGDIAGDTWTIPREKVKKDRAHVIPLTETALATIATLPRHGRGDYVLSTTGGASPSSNFAKTKAELDRLAGLDRPYVIHDIRRTARSKLAELGVSREVARKIMNHEDGKVDRIYSRYDFRAEKRNALELWERHLLSVASGSKSGNR